MRIIIVFILLGLGVVLPVQGGARAQDAARAVPQNQTQVQLSFAPLVRQVAPAVVNIYTKRVVTKRVRHPFLDDPFFGPMFEQQMGGGLTRQQVERSLGSGVIVDKGGVVITNTHVVKDADEIMVVLTDGREFASRVQMMDAPSDVAVLRIDHPPADGLPFAQLEPTEGLQVGDLVLAIGNPFGVGQTVTSGIVSALGRSSFAINDYNYFIQTDAAINPGNSGGPLVSLRGGVVGINTAIYSRDGGSLGIGFAIPSEMVRSVLAGQTGGKDAVARPWLGATSQSVTADIASTLGLALPQGAVIEKLDPQSPLQAAGAQVGDVITALNGHAVKDAAEIRYRSATLPLGSTMSVTVLRAGKSMDLMVQAIAAPDTPARDVRVLQAPLPLRGVQVSNINPAVAVEVGLEGSMKGVVVTAIDPRALAGRFLRAGDVIVGLNGKAIDKTETLEHVAGKIETLFKITFVRDGQTQQLVVR